MKKLLTLIALCCCFSIGFASTISNTKPNIDHNRITDQKSQKEKKAKKTKYDFSLFKFIIPQNQNTESDSVKVEKEISKQKRLSEEISELYEKPRSFLMFS